METLSVCLSIYLSHSLGNRWSTARPGYVGRAKSKRCVLRSFLKISVEVDERKKLAEGCSKGKEHKNKKPSPYLGTLGTNRVIPFIWS